MSTSNMRRFLYDSHALLDNNVLELVLFRYIEYIVCSRTHITMTTTSSIALNRSNTDTCIRESRLIITFNFRITTTNTIDDSMHRRYCVNYSLTTNLYHENDSTFNSGNESCSHSALSLLIDELVDYCNQSTN